MNIPLREYWNLLVGYLRRQKFRVRLLAIVLFISIGLQLLNPQLMRYVIDTALTNGPMETVTLAAAVFLVVAFVQQLSGVLTTYMSETVARTRSSCSAKVESSQKARWITCSKHPKICVNCGADNTFRQH